ncbi:MAG TPA: MBL fold metallo-hydrolase [Candidatus Ornithoclostridium excrementipullorum]|nr:MBL fold metallo-hydrolase [Candidatus Ornithoclostridium excrementipullorum]
MKITWLGHSAFRLEESTGTTVVTDPYSESLVGYRMRKVAADAVTVSHGHKDHCELSRIEGGAEVLDTVGFWEVKGVDITSMLSYHDAAKGAHRGQNLIFKYRMDGVDLCHLGDIGEECGVSTGDAIGTVNVLMIPVGGNYTIDAARAKEYVDFLMPDIVIPMHYRTPSCNIDIERVNDFLDLFDEEQLVYVDGDTIEVDREYFDGDRTKVIVFSDKNF